MLLKILLVMYLIVIQMKLGLHVILDRLRLLRNLQMYHLFLFLKNLLKSQILEMRQ